MSEEHAHSPPPSFGQPVRPRVRPILLGLLASGVLAYALFLTPSQLEQSQVSAPEDPDAYSTPSLKTKIPDLPKDLPDYSLDQFHYASTKGAVRQWRILAARADIFQKEKIVHGRSVTAYLFGDGDQTTTVTAQETRFSMENRNLEMIGQVEAIFPDGYRLKSDYLLYRPSNRTIEIPQKYRVVGTPGLPLKPGAQTRKEEELFFQSQGLHFTMTDQTLHLLSAATVTLKRSASRKNQEGPVDGSPPGLPETTQIESDECWIRRTLHTAEFRMFPTRPLEQRFVRILQPKLLARSRRADLFYAELKQKVSYLQAVEDVLIQERQETAARSSAPQTSRARADSKRGDSSKDPLRYATAGRADFDPQSDTIRLTEFPQAYQGHDTITGEVILVHRDSDLVEVQNSNAYSSGENRLSPR